MQGGGAASNRTSRYNGGKLLYQPGASRESHLYRLKFQEENGRPAKDIEFEAPDSHEALIIAHREARTRSAELWRDGRKLCMIRRSEQEVWEIWPVSPGSA